MVHKVTGKLLHTGETTSSGTSGDQKVLGLT